MEAPLFKVFVSSVPKLVAIVLATALSGCVTQPTVHIYAKYLSKEQKTKLVTHLKETNLRVNVNEFDFPPALSENTIIHSLLLQDPSIIPKTQDVLKELGWEVNAVSPVKQGNHWYTGNSFAVLLRSDNAKNTNEVLKQELAHTFEGQKCGQAVALTLNSNGSYAMSVESLENLTPPQLKGEWRYRQSPYIELQYSDSDYADLYFEVSRYQDADLIGNITILELKFLNTYPFLASCHFVYGVRD